MSNEQTSTEQAALSAAERRHLEGIFRGVRHTLLNRGLYRRLKSGGIQEVSWRRALLLDDMGVIAFEVDVSRLPVKIEQLLNPEVIHQMQACLGGRQVKVTNSRGLLFGVRLEPDPPKPRARLPRRVPLDLNTRPEGTYLVPVGQGTDGPVWRSLLHTGHILVGGETGSGKSTWLNAALLALLAAHPPQELQLAVIDPKEVEFQAYEGLSHLFAPLATDVEEALALIARLMAEMDRRRALFRRARVKNLSCYNQRARESRPEIASEPLPLVLLVIDEVTDIALQAGLKSDFYTNLIRLVSKGRAFGLIVVLATQNPKAEVLNTLIRGNMSTRIAFRVTTAEHSRVILGEGGAQALPRSIRGRLVVRLDRGLETLQGFYIKDQEVEKQVRELQAGGPAVLTELEEEMVRYGMTHLDGKFHIHDLAAAFKGQIGMKRIWRLAKDWERRGWLIPGPRRSDGRRVSEELLGLVSHGKCDS